MPGIIGGIGIFVGALGIYSTIHGYRFAQDFVHKYETSTGIPRDLALLPSAEARVEYLNRVRKVSGLDHLYYYSTLPGRLLALRRLRQR